MCCQTEVLKFTDSDYFVLIDDSSIDQETTQAPDGERTG